MTNQVASNNSCSLVWRYLEQRLDAYRSTETIFVVSLFPEVNVYKRGYEYKKDNLAESSAFIYSLYDSCPPKYRLPLRVSDSWFSTSLSLRLKYNFYISIPLIGRKKTYFFFIPGGLSRKINTLLLTFSSTTLNYLLFRFIS